MQHDAIAQLRAYCGQNLPIDDIAQRLSTTPAAVYDAIRVQARQNSEWKPYEHMYRLRYNAYRQRRALTEADCEALLDEISRDPEGTSRMLYRRGFRPIISRYPGGLQQAWEDAANRALAADREQLARVLESDTYRRIMRKREAFPEVKLLHAIFGDVIPYFELEEPLHRYVQDYMQRNPPGRDIEGYLAALAAAAQETFSRELHVFREGLRGLLYGIIDETLEPFERSVLRFRIEEGVNYEITARLLGRTRELIVQTERGALRKLRRPRRKGRIEQYLMERRLSTFPE